MAGPPDAPSPSDPAPPSRTLVTFDVDGTLIRAVGEGANQFHKDAFAVAIEAVHGLKTHIDVIKHHGSTDQLVVADVLRHHGFAEDAIWSNMPATCEKMLEHAAETEADAANGLELLPGVRELLETLAARTDVVVGLVTGNLAPIAWAKMRALKIDRLFSQPPPSDAAAPPGAILGGYGSDHVDRGELVVLAARRAAAGTWSLGDLPGASDSAVELGVAFRERCHFGDTPNDVRAAAFGGALAVGVTTGVFDRAELEDDGATGAKAGRRVVFDGLEDTGEVLRACGLSV